MTTTNFDDAVALDHRVGSTGRLSIHLANAEVRIAGTNTDRIVVRSRPDGSLPGRVVVETTDDSLAIRERDLGLMRSGRKVVQLEIEMPAAGRADIEMASGWLDVQRLTGDQRYRTASADLRLVGIAGSLDLNTVSGDATIELAGTTDVRIRSVSGDVTVTGGEVGTLRVGTTSGDVRVDSPLVGRDGHAIETLSGDVSLVAATGIRVEARTVSGDLTSDLPHRSDGRMGRRTLVIGDGGVEVTFRSVSGDLRIRDHGALGGGRTSLAEEWTPDVPEAAPPTVPAPAAPIPPAAPASPDRATPPGNPTASDPEGEEPAERERMTILRALEVGELDVATALDRLAALDDARGATEAASDG